jgi:hypothetical protein
VTFGANGVEPNAELSVQGSTITLKLYGTKLKSAGPSPDIAPAEQTASAELTGLSLQAGTTYRVIVVGEDNQLLMRRPYTFIYGGHPA